MKVQKGRAVGGVAVSVLKNDNGKPSVHLVIEPEMGERVTMVLGPAVADTLESLLSWANQEVARG